MKLNYTECPDCGARTFWVLLAETGDRELVDPTVERRYVLTYRGHELVPLARGVETFSIHICKKETVK